MTSMQPNPDPDITPNTSPNTLPHTHQECLAAAPADFPAEQVLQWLQRHPEFLTRYAAQLPLSLPKYTRKANVTPLHAARADRAEQQMTRTKTQAEQLVRLAAANAQTARELYVVLPQLVACQTLPELRQFLQTHLRDGLRLDTVRLLHIGHQETATSITSAQVQSLCPGLITLRTQLTQEERDFYGNRGKAVASDCLLRLEHAGTVLGLLALGSAEAQRFFPTQGTELAELLRQLVSVTLWQCHGAHA